MSSYDIRAGRRPQRGSSPRMAKRCTQDTTSSSHTHSRQHKLITVLVSSEIRCSLRTPLNMMLLEAGHQLEILYKLKPTCHTPPPEPFGQLGPSVPCQTPPVMDNVLLFQQYLLNNYTPTTHKVPGHCCTISEAC